MPKGITIGGIKEVPCKKPRRVCRAKASDYFDKGNDKETKEHNKGSDKDKDKDNDDIKDWKLPSKEDAGEDSSVGSIGSIKEGKLSLNPDLQKILTFHLHGGNNKVEEEDDEDQTSNKDETSNNNSPRRSLMLP